MGEVIKIDPDRMAECDGCFKSMTLQEYQEHECQAYFDLPFKNPLAHKMSSATWMTPKGKVVARGRCLTKEDIEAAAKG